MASGNVLCKLFPAANEPPASNPATPDTRNGHPILCFDASTDESALFTDFLPDNYAGGGLTVVANFFAVATSGNVVVTAELERMANNGDDLDSDSFASAKSQTVAVNGTSGKIFQATWSFSSGAEMDSIAALEQFRIRITRDADNGSDTATGDLQFTGGIIKET